jgi:hypothetical protein
MVSKTRMGPVEPMIVRGWPENKPYPTPTIKPENKCLEKYFDDLVN